MQSLQLPVIHSHCLGGIQRTWSHPSTGPCSKARPIIVLNYHLPWHSWEAARGERPACCICQCLSQHSPSHLAPKASGKSSLQRFCKVTLQQVNNCSRARELKHFPSNLHPEGTREHRYQALQTGSCIVGRTFSFL